MAASALIVECVMGTDARSQATGGRVFKEADSAGIRLRVISRMQRLAPLDLKSASVPILRCAMDIRRVTAIMDHQTPLSVTADSRGRVGKGLPRGELHLELLAALPAHPRLLLMGDNNSYR